MCLEAEAVIVDVEGVHGTAVVMVPHGLKLWPVNLTLCVLYHEPMLASHHFGLFLFF